MASDLLKWFKILFAVCLIGTVFSITFIPFVGGFIGLPILLDVGVILGSILFLASGLFGFVSLTLWVVGKLK